MTDRTDWQEFQRFWSAPLGAWVIVERNDRGHSRSRTEKGAR